MEFKIGESVMISNQYFMDKKIIDMPLYGTIVDKNEHTNELRIEDVDGNRYIINAWLCEKDNIRQMKDKETDTKQELEVKRLIRFIKEEVDNDNGRRRVKARNRLDDYLFVCEDDLKRINNELNLRRAIYKYDELANRQIEREKDNLDQDDIDLRKSIIEGKVFEVYGELQEFGIFSEYEDDRKKEKEELNVSRNNNVVKEDPLASMKAMINFLDMIDKSIVKDDDNIEEDEDDFDGADSDAKNFGPFGLSTYSIQAQPKKGKLPDCLIDMTDLARRGRYNDIIGREDEIDQVAETLARKEIRNPLLIGKPGAGKTAVVEELVKRSSEGKIDHLKNKHFYELRMNDLVAGTMYRGQLEEKLQSVMKVLEDDPNVVLFIDEVHMIVQAGSTANDKNDVANALKPYLTSEISIIGATTYDEYRATFENDGALARRFNPIEIEEKTKEESIEILNKVKERFENYHHVNLSEKAIEEIVDIVSEKSIDNSIIAASITAIDTICTKMKIKNLSEKQALRKWSDEVVLGVDRTNKGGKTSKIGFSFDDEEELDELNEMNNEFKEEVEDENDIEEFTKALDNEVIQLEDKRKDILKIEGPTNENIITDLDEEIIKDLLDEEKFGLPSFEEYKAYTFDDSFEGYQAFLMEVVKEKLDINKVEPYLIDEDENDIDEDEEDNEL